jgi:general secretion pathway protein G
LKKREFGKGIKMIARKGFTLVELLLVVLVVAILASIVVPRLSGASAEAQKSKCNANWANLIRTLELYAANNNGVYPANQAAFDAGILNNVTYFPHGSPVCGYGSSYVYVSTSGQETVTQHSH